MPIPYTYHTREYHPEDAGSIAMLLNRVEQEPESAESIRIRFANYPRHLAGRRWVVEDQRNRVIAYASSLSLSEKDGSPFLVRVFVDDDHTGLDIGRSLLETCERLAWDHGAPRVMSKVRDDMSRELRFARNAGYSEVQHMLGVELDLAAFEAPDELPDLGDISIKTWAELGDSPENRRRMYDLYTTADRDTPGIEMWGEESFDSWISVLSSNWFRPEGCIVAIDTGSSDRWVGLNLGGPKTVTDFTTDFTGVLSEYRRRGIGYALKVRGALWAKSEGGTRVHTFNDETNMAIRNINARLGFQPRTGWRNLRKELDRYPGS